VRTRGFANSAVQQIVRKLGYVVIPAWRLGRLEQATYLTRLFELLQIDCVLDVGANLGQYRDFLRSEVGYEGSIVSYEPIPSHVEILRARAAKDSKWLVEGYALGSECTRRRLNVMSSSTFSSFLRPDHAGVARFEKVNVVQDSVEVDILTLDESVSRLDARVDARSSASWRRFLPASPVTKCVTGGRRVGGAGPVPDRSAVAPVTKCPCSPRHGRRSCRDETMARVDIGRARDRCVGDGKPCSLSGPVVAAVMKRSVGVGARRSSLRR